MNECARRHNLFFIEQFLLNQRLFKCSELYRRIVFLRLELIFCFHKITTNVVPGLFVWWKKTRTIFHLSFMLTWHHLLWAEKTKLPYCTSPKQTVFLLHKFPDVETSSQFVHCYCSSIRFLFRSCWRGIKVFKMVLRKRSYYPYKTNLILRLTSGL